MKVRSLFTLLSILLFSGLNLQAQELMNGPVDDPCTNRQTTVEGQILYLTQGQRLVKFKFIPELFEYGVANGIWTIVEVGTNDTFSIWGNDIPLVFDRELNALCVLNHDSLMYGANAELRTHKETDYLTCYPKSTEFKGILTFLVDYDSVDIGGRCNFTGYYLMDFKPSGKPFTFPYILNRDSFNIVKANLPKLPVHCDRDIRQFGIFKDSASGDLLKVEYVYHSTKNMAKMSYQKKGSKKWKDISPATPNTFGNQRISPFFANDPKHRIFPDYSSSIFIFMNNGNWISPAVPGNAMYYPDGNYPKGVKPVPSIPFKSFKRLN